MNPFALSGPAFLLFYALFAIAVLFLVHFVRRFRESGPLPKLGLRDPYLLACLRGGPAEVIRVSIAGLIDRGLLQASGDTARPSSEDAAAVGAAPVERIVLGHFRGGASLSAAGRNRDLVDAAGAEYEHRLRSVGLLPNLEAERIRRLEASLAVAALALVGGAKVLVALSDGRTNVLFLIALVIVAIVIAVLIFNPYRTQLGDNYLTSVCGLFENLRRRSSSIEPGCGTRELLWLTSLFGGAALSSSTFPALAQVWRNPDDKRGPGCGGGGGGDSGAGGCGGCGGGGACGG